MADNAILDNIHNLSDLELAALLCLINKEHCVIDTDPDVIDDLVQELALVGNLVISLCHKLTTVNR
jgi:hypothetical protein